MSPLSSALIADQRAAQIQPAIDRQAGLALDRLRDSLAEDQAAR